MLNLALIKNPVNWAIVGSLALFGLIFASLISAPLRGNSQPA
jgi:hypothetical protein